MAFTNVPLRRAIPAGISAFLIQYAVVFVLFGSQVSSLLQAKTIELGYGSGSKSILELIGGSPLPWKMAGWMLHSGHGVNLIVRLSNYGKSTEINLVALAGGWAQTLYLLPPVVLFVAGYLVARTSRTYGAHGDDYAGASIALSYGLCYFVSGFVFMVDANSARADPNMYTGLYLGCLIYPLAFGWFGGRVARLRAKSSGESAAESACN
ncbi:hypothetical protein [Haladaptatus sp. DFWS20]|uniref:hypothetical protein n=1 Tax=Haladaptatus sp. DFWS20 TaxID=3403467 RepID=UPI003EBFBE22